MKVAGGVVAFIGWLLAGGVLSVLLGRLTDLGWGYMALAWTALTLMRLGNAMTAVSDE